MPVYRVDIEKTDDVYWTNRYHVNAVNPNEAFAAAQEIAAVERAQTASYITFTKARVSLAATVGVDDYTNIPLNYAGQRTATGVLPYFVATRIELYSGPGRPDIKYYKGMADPNDLNSPSVWKPAYLTTIGTGLCAALAGVEGLCNAQGLAYSTIAPAIKVGMRQLRRGTRKVTTPVI